MKKISLKIMLQMVLVLLVKFSTGQTLVMDGRITDETGRRIHGYYELRNSHNQQVMGMGSKLKIELNENDVYTLIFSKPGYQTKVIVVTTFEEDDLDYTFSFDVVLKRMDLNEDIQPEALAGNIFYDFASSQYVSSLDYEQDNATASAELVVNETKKN